MSARMQGLGIGLILLLAGARAGLDSLLYAIAADSELARAYTEAMR